jgi:predicted metal-dependent hydrolase
VEDRCRVCGTFIGDAFDSSSSVLIREPKERWGGRRQGNMRFKKRIIQTPTRLIDYVVAHELVHLAHPATRDFWSTLGRAMRDYEIRREALRRLGREVVW